MMPRIHWMFSCREVARRVSRAMDDPPPLHHRFMIWMHHSMCLYCERFAKQLKLLRILCCNQALYEKSADSTPGLSDDARNRIKNNLKKKQAKRAGDG